MKQQNTMLVVADMERAVDFYTRVLGLEVILDFGANKTLTGGLALQTFETWRTFIDNQSVIFGGNDCEIYFEEDDFDAFIAHLNFLETEHLQTQKASEILEIEYVHPVLEHSWGQRVVRFRDPDRHIIEVGENMRSVVHRFKSVGMSAEQIAVRMDVPKTYVEDCLI